ncbi:cytosine/adenosine deaminase-related metal-dependent hydrolase [Pararhizobium capsulatum DSM 1112]|uniref:Cytosine/adenosine deaminase-related metal-dependent hydrolase n=1 Tax=Pararhizobium capsulatum DSM 1112 TaxID=1121113 RepID=A0ABU0C119_9HYPH|nr:amidohydrolase family protein [Pararhizobium capsulatum]MDQ0323873.1 cytosine/adenosine deaminase-related metal-dependent hydrolase [Pararhizobium capsulatum DSM 1112]
MAIVLLKPEYLLTSHDAQLEKEHGVVVEGNRIAKTGPFAELASAFPEAEIIDLPDAILMPGLVNAHQHGRGISQIQLGYPDQRLELWMAQRRGRGSPDLQAIGLLASLEMLRNGVTCAVHADLAYGTGDYESELRSSIAGYAAGGLRACIAIGVCDQGNIVFPQEMEAAFLKSLPADLAARLEERNSPPYEKDFATTSALLDRLLADFGDDDKLSFCYGPSGPQWVTDPLFASVAADAARRGIGLHIHALETTGQYAACLHLYPEGTMRHLASLGAIGPKTVIAHGVFLTDDDIAVLAEGHAMVATNPGSNLRLCDATAPVPKLIASGVRVGVGSDNSSVMDDEDLFSEARVASMLTGRRNWSSPPKPTARQVIEMLTTSGAAIAGFDGRIGRLEKGWLADMTAFSLGRTRGAYLDEDMPIVDALVARARGADACLTMVGGQVLYRDGVLVGADIDAAGRQAGTAAKTARLPTSPEDVTFTDQLRPHLTDFYSRLTAATEFPDILS